MLFVRLNTVEVKAPDGIDPSKIYGVEMLWNNSMAVNDVAVSGDGNYLAAVNNTGLYYFASDNSTPKWWYPSQSAILSAAISDEGEYVVTGSSDGYIYYFNDSRAITGERPSPAWNSSYLYGPVERGTLDISGDGEYVAIGGTGPNMYYYANCSARSGLNQFATWIDYLHYDVFAVQISPDGKYVAAGGMTISSGGFVALYKDANNVTSSPNPPDWYATSSINTSITDLAVSDDGYAVVAIDEGAPTTLYYWANATTLSGDPDATWTNDRAFHCVDMSADGDEVIAGTALYPCGLHFWADARERSGYGQAENWTRREGEIIWDAAMSDDGGIIAASVQAESNYTAYFFKSNGDLIRAFDLENGGLVSMSGDGHITAVAGPGWDSLYVFEVLEDSTPPLIENVHQQPTNENVHPEDDVMVYANVTDDLSGVKQVILNCTYTNSTGTWHGTITMDNPEGNIYNGTIPRLPYCTNVTYVIIAEDNFNNTVTTEEMGREYKYHVIPEFPPQFVLPLLVTATLLAMLLRKRKLIHQAKT
jgi:WD40 repeat protein